VSRSSAKPPSRPSREWTLPTPDEDIKSHPIPVAGFIGALTAALFGLIITFLIVITAWLIAAHGDESVNQVAAASGVAWLGLQLVPVSIGGHALGLLPWGFIIIPIFLTWRGMHWSLKSAEPKTANEFWQTAIFFSVSYGLVSATVAAFASTTDLNVNVIDAALRSTILALCVAVACVLTFAPSKSLLIDSLPASIANGIRPGILAFLFLIVAGGLLCSASLIIHFNELTAVFKLMTPQALDGFFLMLLCLGYIPTAFVWAMAFVIGPGINVGGSTVLSVTQTHTGALPAFPLFSILPSSAQTWMSLLVLVPIAAGIVLYFLLPREHWSAQGPGFTKVMRKLATPSELITVSVAVAVTAGCVFLVSVASSGPLGTQLLKFVGPSPVMLAGTTAFILGVVATILLLVPRFLLGLFYLWQHRGASSEGDGN